MLYTTCTVSIIAIVSPSVISGMVQSCMHIPLQPDLIPTLWIVLENFVLLLKASTNGSACAHTTQAGNVGGLSDSWFQGNHDMNI